MNEENLNETPIAKLRNQLGPAYALAEMVLLLDKNPDMKKLVLQQAEQTIINKRRIRELLEEMEAGFDIKTVLDKMENSERMEIFSLYCRYCGCNDPNCACWNDD